MDATSLSTSAKASVDKLVALAEALAEVDKLVASILKANKLLIY